MFNLYSGSAWWSEDIGGGSVHLVGQESSSGQLLSGDISLPTTGFKRDEQMTSVTALTRALEKTEIAENWPEVCLNCSKIGNRFASKGRCEEALEYNLKR